MKERSSHAENATTRQLERVVSLNTSKQYMKERSINAGNVTTRQLQRVVSLNTSEQYMKNIFFRLDNDSNPRNNGIIEFIAIQTYETHQYQSKP